MQTAELIALPLAERLQAMEALWDSLCRSEGKDSPPSARLGKFAPSCLADLE
jgi:hypothetical protein